MIRVGERFLSHGHHDAHYARPLPILHSARSCVNWRIHRPMPLDRLDLGPDFRLEDGKRDLRQSGHLGAQFPLFTTGRSTSSPTSTASVCRFYRATDPRGPWQHNRMEGLHDLSVSLLTMTAKIYAVYGARTIHIVEFNQDLTAPVPGSDMSSSIKARAWEKARTSTNQGKILHCQRDSRRSCAHEMRPRRTSSTRACGRSPRTSAKARASNWPGLPSEEQPPLRIRPSKSNPPDAGENHSLTLHQGGIVDTPTGDMVGVLDAGPQHRSPPDFPFTGHLDRRVACYF